MPQILGQDPLSLRLSGPPTSLRNTFDGQGEMKVLAPACRGAQWPRDAARNANDEVLPAEQIKRLDGLFGEETMTAETWRSDLP